MSIEQWTPGELIDPYDAVCSAPGLSEFSLLTLVEEPTFMLWRFFLVILIFHSSIPNTFRGEIFVEGRRMFWGVTEKELPLLCVS